MPNQNGRTMRDENQNQNRPSWRQQDMDDDRNERMMRGGNESRSGSRREWDEDEGYRSTDRYGGGQSGYGAGRFGDDRSMGPGYRNQRQWNRDYDDRQGMHTDDRFTGRGGSQYWDERGERGHEMRNRDDRFERTNYNSGYNQGQMGYGGYGREGIGQNVGGQSGVRGGSGGAQFADDYNRGRGMMQDRDFDQGMGYGQGHGMGLGQGMGHQGQRQGGMQGQGGYYGQGGVGGGYGGGGNFGGNVHGNTGYGGSGMQGSYGSQGGYGQGMQGNYGGGMQGGSGYGQGMNGGYGGQQDFRGGHRGKGPTGYTRSDDRIKEQICEALSDDDHIDATHIEVVVKNGEVILTGMVDDRRTKRLAEDLVERMPGVKDVQNQLRVGRGNQESGRAVGKNETETSATDKKHRA